MKSNFDFLKNKDKKLFDIIDKAEKLYRDGYFEQTAAQTRKFAEIIAKNTLGIRRTTEETFDDILSTLSDIQGDSPVEKEFMDDMYFIKKQGNLAVHDSAAPIDGNVALECLKRAFEIGIGYSIKNKFSDKKLLKLNYSIDLLMSGENYKFSEKYQEARTEASDSLSTEVKKIAKSAQAPEKNKKTGAKVLTADFKNKKRIVQNDVKNKTQKEVKPAGKSKNKKKNSDSLFTFGENFLYAVIIGILVILLFCILLFVLPF